MLGFLGLDTDSDLAQGLVYWWATPPHRAGGAYMQELVGGRFHAKRVGCSWGGATWTGTGGGCPSNFTPLNFNGSSDYCLVESGNAVNWSPGAGGVDGIQLTISCWVYWPNNGGNGMLVEMEPVNQRFELFIESGILKIRGAAGDDHCTVTYPGDTAWHHIVATYTNKVTGVTFADRRLYIDGVLQATAGGSDTQNFVADGSKINIGDYDSGTAYFLKGLIADVMIFDKTLSSAEVWNLYVEGRKGYPNLLPSREKAGSVISAAFIGDDDDNALTYSPIMYW